MSKKLKNLLALLKEENDSQSGEYDYEGSMAKSQLKSIINNAQELHDALSDTANLPEWVQSKITLAEDYILTSNNYIKTEIQSGNISEGILTPVKAAISAHKAGKEAYKKELKANLPYIKAHGTTPGKILELTGESRKSAKDRAKIAKKNEYKNFVSMSKVKEDEAKAGSTLGKYIKDTSKG
jgi:hypothetical protein